ncbi:MAG TPA: NmrA family NAD(P)-binding protein [Chthoniobacteraceae bacterium]
MSLSTTVALAGARGDLGARITKALVARGAEVRALLDPEAGTAEGSRLEALGARVFPAHPEDVASMALACAGTSCVVSALNGLRDVIIGRQSRLLEAAVIARVPRFIPSDFSADFTKTRPGQNRNFDLRREFMSLADRASISVTSIFNGAFMDMLGAEMPLIQPRIRRVLYWQSADQLLDFTTKDDVAAYTAAAALDPAAPRILRIAGDSLCARELAAIMSVFSNKHYRTQWVGTVGTLGAMIRLTKLLAPQSEATFPAWQGMQYMRDQFSGRAKLSPLDNARYPDVKWTSARDHLEHLVSSKRMS